MNKERRHPVLSRGFCERCGRLLPLGSGWHMCDDCRAAIKQQRREREAKEQTDLFPGPGASAA